VALADAGALDDPVVAGIDKFRQIDIGDNVGRQIAANARDSTAKAW
jgi:hypothetical protein